MENKLSIKLALIVIIILSANSCLQDVDLSGLLTSSDRVTERFEQSEMWNNSHPARGIFINSNDYFITLASDPHIGEIDKLRDFISISNESGASSFILTGDMVSGKERDYDLLNQLLIQADSLPYFLVSGNHDLYFDGWKSFYNYFGSSVYSFTVETKTAEDIFICLDSGNGTLGKKQIDWLENLLENERNNYRYCFVLSHNNFFRKPRTTSGNPPLEELYVLLDMFSVNNVNMVISGHAHHRSEEKLGKTSYITLDALHENNKNSSYLELTIAKGDIYYIFREL